MSITELTTNALVNLMSGISNFVLKIIYTLTLPLWNLASSSFPNFEWYLADLRNMLYSFLKYVFFILDASLINKAIITYVVMSIIFRISLKFVAYSIKVVVKWWHYLAP